MDCKKMAYPKSCAHVQRRYVGDYIGIIHHHGKHSKHRQYRQNSVEGAPAGIIGKNLEEGECHACE